MFVIRIFLIDTYVEMQKLLHVKEALLDNSDSVPQTEAFSEQLDDSITTGIFVNNVRSRMSCRLIL